MLYLLGTPIGNLGDISVRAKDVFEKLNILYCEDTRSTGKLLKLLGISNKPRLVRADANKLFYIVPQIIKDSQEHEVGFVSDAGMPGISDPGLELTNECLKKGVIFEIIPGLSALPIAILASGFVNLDFKFVGFLPKKKGRQTLLNGFRESPDAIIFYESPIRIKKTLSELYDILGDRIVCVMQELTKLHETIIRGPISVVIPQIKEKGEFVVVLAPGDYK